MNNSFHIQTNNLNIDTGRINEYVASVLPTVPPIPTGGANVTVISSTTSQSQGYPTAPLPPQPPIQYAMPHQQPRQPPRDQHPTSHIKVTVINGPGSTSEPDGNAPGSTNEPYGGATTDQQPLITDAPIMVQPSQPWPDEDEPVKQVRIRKRTKVETKIYTKIIQEIYEEIEKQPEEGAKPSCFENGFDLCSYSFLHTKKTDDKKGQFLSPKLRDGRKNGVTTIKRLIFPLARDPIRVIWVYAELILVVIGLLLSIITFGVSIFETIHMAFSIMALVLTITDVFFLVDCSRCKGSTQCIQKTFCCSKCCSGLKTVVDVTRAVLAEGILIPLLLLDILDFVTGQGYKPTDLSGYLALALFVVDGLNFLLYVYLVRFCIIAGFIVSIFKAQSPSKEQTEGKERATLNPAYRRKTLIYQLCFLVHFIAQMLLQLAMLVAFGLKLHVDNLHLFDQTSGNEDANVSTQVLIMGAAIYVLPICGFFTFFITTNYWVQEFPISMFLGFFKAMATPGSDEALDMKVAVDKVSKETKKDLIQAKEVMSDYKELKKKSFCSKFLYPFTSPVLALFCVVFALSQLVFGGCVLVAVDEIGQISIQHQEGYEWATYYFIAVVVFDILANLYVFAVAVVWVIVYVLGLVVAVVLMVIVVLSPPIARFLTCQHKI